MSVMRSFIRYVDSGYYDHPDIPDAPVVLGKGLAVENCRWVGRSAYGATGTASAQFSQAQ